MRTIGYAVGVVMFWVPVLAWFLIGFMEFGWRTAAKILLRVAGVIAWFAAAFWLMR
jgi:hypothetical protein